MTRDVPYGDEVDKCNDSRGVGRWHGRYRQDDDVGDEDVHHRSSSSRSKTSCLYKQLFEVYGPKFVLEVLGSSGAVWGSSEVFGLRNEETREFWRHSAIIVGIVFLSRWIRQIYSSTTIAASVDVLEVHQPDVLHVPRTRTATSPVRPIRLDESFTSSVFMGSPSGAEMTSLISKK